MADKQPGQGAGALVTDSLDGELIVHLRINAKAARLRIVRSVVKEAASACGCSENCIRDMVIAVDEACQNVIRHAYADKQEGDILLDIRQHEDRIEFSVVDFAAPVDVAAVKPRELGELRPGGLGTHFIHQCMDKVEFVEPPQGAGNRLQMSKRIE
jgi:sigma-B regulation protein RsbU (phosphoserine phosphatase)